MRSRACLPLLAIAVLGAGCGAGRDKKGPTGPVKSVPAGQPVRVVAKEYSFTPARVSTDGSMPLRVALDNQGDLAHNLKVFQGDRQLGGTPTFQEGIREASLTLAPGKYRMVCTVGNHEELGMVGDLEVTER